MMTTRPPVSFPPRTALVGSDVLQGAIALLRNRMPAWNYTTAFNHVANANQDLMRPAYDHSHSAQTLGVLLNRLEKNSGLTPSASIRRSASDVASLTKRFAPAFIGSPTALQWDVLARATDALERAGVPDKLVNRTPDGVADADWREAAAKASGVLSLLDSEANAIPDRGPILENADERVVCGVFRKAIQQLMNPPTNPRRPGNLSREAAFNWLRQNEPIFWTLAMLSFQPDES